MSNTCIDVGIDGTALLIPLLRKTIHCVRRPIKDKLIFHFSVKSTFSVKWVSVKSVLSSRILPNPLNAKPPGPGKPGGGVGGPGGALKRTN